MIRGSGNVTNIKTTETSTSIGIGNTVAKWHVYDNEPAGATITQETATINDRQYSTLLLQGSTTNNGYQYGGRTSHDGWNNQIDNTLEWIMNYNEPFVIYIPISTTEGDRYLIYKAINEDLGISGNSIRLGLGSDADNGTWQTFKRNLATDLQQFEPNNALIAINGFMIRGSGTLADIQTSQTSTTPVCQVSDEDRAYFERIRNYPEERIITIDNTSYLYDVYDDNDHEHKYNGLHKISSLDTPEETCLENTIRFRYAYGFEEFFQVNDNTLALITRFADWHFTTFHLDTFTIVDHQIFGDYYCCYDHIELENSDLFYIPVPSEDGTMYPFFYIDHEDHIINPLHFAIDDWHEARNLTINTTDNGIRLHIQYEQYQYATDDWTDEHLIYDISDVANITQL